MVTDATNAIQWTHNNIHKYGGDKHNMYIISQSAGAHIGALMMLLQARKVQVYNKLKSYLIELKLCQKQNKMNASNNINGNINDIELNDVITQIEDKLMDDEYDSLWNPQTDLKAFVGIAGPYNLEDMKHHLDDRGLYLEVMDKLMENNLRAASPFYCVYDLFISPKDNRRKLKPLNKIGRIDGGYNNKAFISMTGINYDANNEGSQGTDSDNDND
eukprot:UN06469